MRLYLSSFGLGDRPEEFAALCGPAKRVAIVVNALDNRPRARADWLKDQTDNLTSLGLVAFELDLRDYFAAQGRLGEAMRRVDAVWASGGNTFILRRAMKQSGFDALITTAVARDAIAYGGFSAGGGIAPDRESTRPHPS